MASNRTYGDLNAIDCPHCGKPIRDLWDRGRVDIGDEIECERCSGTSVVEDRSVEITLCSKTVARTESGG